MRYLTVTYIKKPNGQMDESVSVAKSLKNKDLATASVILDFSTCSVIKCSMNGTTVPKDWQRIRDFYYRHYPQYIDQLEKVNTPSIQLGTAD
jgi:hypothetical protein